jgi:hypothetical protein
MPAGSKNKRFSFIDERTRITLSAQWQALRRHPEYGHAVQTCLKEVAEQLNILEHSLVYSGSYWITKNTLTDIANLSRTLRSQTFPMAFEAGIPAEMYKSFRATANTVLRLCRTENRDLFPPLARFERDWGIRIPLDPAIPFLPNFVALHVFQTDYEVSITSFVPGREVMVEFRIRPEASQEVLLAQFDTILQVYGPWNDAPKVPRTRQRRELAHYDEMFRAYDLHQQGQSLGEIARQLWPKEFERDQRPYPQKNPIVQRAHDRIKGAQRRIRDAKK